MTLHRVKPHRVILVQTRKSGEKKRGLKVITDFSLSLLLIPVHLPPLRASKGIFSAQISCTDRQLPRIFSREPLHLFSGSQERKGVRDFISHCPCVKRRKRKIWEKIEEDAIRDEIHLSLSFPGASSDSYPKRSILSRSLDL